LGKEIWNFSCEAYFSLKNASLLKPEQFAERLCCSESVHLLASWKSFGTAEMLFVSIILQILSLSSVGVKKIELDFQK